MNASERAAARMERNLGELRATLITKMKHTARELEEDVEKISLSEEAVNRYGNCQSGQEINRLSAEYCTLRDAIRTIKEANKDDREDTKE